MQTKTISLALRTALLGWLNDVNSPEPSEKAREYGLCSYVGYGGTLYAEFSALLDKEFEETATCPFNKGYGEYCVASENMTQHLNERRKAWVVKTVTTFTKAEASEAIFEALKADKVCSATYDGTASIEKAKREGHEDGGQHRKRAGKRCVVGHLIDPALARNIQISDTSYEAYPMAAKLVQQGAVRIIDLPDNGQHWLTKVQQHVDAGRLSGILLAIGQDPDYVFGNNRTMLE